MIDTDNSQKEHTETWTINGRSFDPDNRPMDLGLVVAQAAAL